MITYRYDAYGNTTKSNNTLNNPYQYNAEYTDSSTELQYLRARYYDSSQGRFTTKDTYLGTILNPLSRNLYTYVENNPLNYIDPSGHKRLGKKGKPVASSKGAKGFNAAVIKKSTPKKPVDFKTALNYTNSLNKSPYGRYSYQVPVRGSVSGTLTTRTNSIMQLALAERHRQMCESYTTKAKDTGTKNVSFRDKVRAKTGLDIYAAGDAALSFAGAVGSVVAAGVGILAVPETGGAGLILTAFGASSAVFAASDFVEYIHDINVGKDGEYRHGTENRSYNTIYDGLFKKNDSVYNGVRNFVDIGTSIFSIGTAINSISKTPAQKIKDVTGKNKYVPSNNKNVFPENPNGFNPNGYRKETYETRNGKIIKWFDENGKAVYEWDEDIANSSHYHVIGDDGNTRMPNSFGETHFNPGDDIP